MFTFGYKLTKINYMSYTNRQAAELLKTIVKPYNKVEPEIQQCTFSKTIRLVEKSKCKPITAEEFLKKFGFIGTWNAWELDIDNWHLNDYKK